MVEKNIDGEKKKGGAPSTKAKAKGKGEKKAAVPKVPVKVVPPSSPLTVQDSPIARRIGGGGRPCDKQSEGEFNVNYLICCNINNQID